MGENVCVSLIDQAKANIKRLWGSEVRPVATLREVEALRGELDSLWPYAERERELGRDATRITLVRVRESRRSVTETAAVYDCSTGEIVLQRREIRDGLEYVTLRKGYREDQGLSDEIGGLDALRFGLEAALAKCRLVEAELAREGEDFGAYMIRVSMMTDAVWEWSRPVEWTGAVRWVWETGTLSQMVRLVRWADGHEGGAPQWFVDSCLGWLRRQRVGRLSSRGRLLVSTWLDTTSDAFRAELVEQLQARGAMSEAGDILNT